MPDSGDEAAFAKGVLAGDGGHTAELQRPAFIDVPDAAELQLVFAAADEERFLAAVADRIEGLDQQQKVVGRAG